ncbi:2-oxo-tetronate isomerase [Zophobihabitans entericus]|uniref:Hydroxypyruvate isomerase family protein n=1 Tax=Zophobihabitans entericus TaxID=1635327 RepID=A0A6G9I7N7_9GAMM|nr:2-oxo-tetronate isomerase [Zophobihabitans entericus]QIQ20223.1 hydroxypyruvate isomerase family protein [Zophobihabitans entericus]
MPKFAANLTTMFTEYPFLERFKAAAQAGFRAVEFLSPFEYPASVLKQELDNHGLQLVLFNTTVGNTAKGEWGLNALPGRESDARANIDLALEYALALNCQTIHVMAGVVPEGQQQYLYEQVQVDNVRYAADKYAPHNISIVLEALSDVVKPNYLYASQYHTLKLVKRINRPNVSVQIDLFHAQIVDGNLTHLLQNLNGHFGHIQVASVPDRHEPDDGEVNFTYLFNLLDQLGYSGWIGCEYIPKNTTKAGLNWIKPYL